MRIYAIFLGFLLDLLAGDPYWLYHPVRLIGKLISGLVKPHFGRNVSTKADIWGW